MRKSVVVFTSGSSVVKIFHYGPKGYEFKSYHYQVATVGIRLGCVGVWELTDTNSEWVAAKKDSLAKKDTNEPTQDQGGSPFEDNPTEVSPPYNVPTNPHLCTLVRSDYWNAARSGYLKAARSGCWKASRSGYWKAARCDHWNAARCIVASSIRRGAPSWIDDATLPSSGRTLQPSSSHSLKPFSSHFLQSVKVTPLAF